MFCRNLRKTNSFIEGHFTTLHHANTHLYWPDFGMCSTTTCCKNVHTGTLSYILHTYYIPCIIAGLKMAKKGWDRMSFQIMAAIFALFFVLFKCAQYNFTLSLPFHSCFFFLFPLGFLTNCRGGVRVHTGWVQDRINGTQKNSAFKDKIFKSFKALQQF